MPPRPLRAILSISLLLTGCLAVESLRALPPESRVTFLGPQPALQIRELLQKEGAELVAKESSPTLVFIDSSAEISEADRDALTHLLQQGGSIFVYLTGKPAALDRLSSLLPVNLWTAQQPNYIRGETSALHPVDPALSAIETKPGFRLTQRFDLHLPLSTMETGQQRYEWQRMGKPLWNTDWRVLLRADQDGQLPLLVEGRVFAGRVFVFAGNLFNGDLAAWPGYPQFLGQLLALAHPERPSGDPAAAQLKLSIPLHQPGAELIVQIENPTASPVKSALFFKVRDLVQGLVASHSSEIVVPARSQITAPVQLPAEISGPQSVGSAQFLRVEAGISSPSREEILQSASAIVDRTPALTLEVEGEDVRQFPERKGWPAGGIDFLKGTGMPLARYVYPAGDKPKLKIRLANALHNIAPLAKPADLAWPENPSVQGLNDGALGYGDVRGKFDIFSFWAGRSGAEQKIALTWPQPVTIAGQALYAQSDYRKWDRSNPRNYTLSAGDGEPAATVNRAAYEFWRREDFFQPRQTTECTLTITDLDASANQEPTPLRSLPDFKDIPTNCALGEWLVYGWPSAQTPASVTGKLRVLAHDLSSDQTTLLLEKDVTIDPLSRQVFEVEAPTRADFGQVVIRAEFQTGSDSRVASSLPLIFTAPDAPTLRPRASLGEEEMGFLCSPGFVALEEFGKGTNDDTQGWGGADDKAWAWAHDLMEMGPQNPETVRRLFLSPVGMSHYTTPWRDFPSGRYVWDWATDQLVERFTTGRSAGKKSVLVGLSDRWNGVPINATFAWADIVSFDEYLRGQGLPGLTKRTRKDLAQEITTQYADKYQTFHLTRYADAILESRKRMADLGVQLTVETHGSFPLAGGELGEKLGQTHKSVGTDLFWELRWEDLYKSIGYRFGLVAANPDLESGAYDQWGWISGAQANPTWFSPSGAVEPSRRQWYGTYWAGRVNSEGSFQPYTVFGFSLQGNYGTKNTEEDWTAFNRVQSTMVHVRPERACGFGLVVSWPLQQRRMGPEAGRLGFGLFAAKDREQIDQTAGELYQALVKNGVPLSFVASTHTLRKWDGRQPLVVADGFETEAWEIQELDRLNRAGTPVIAVGSAESTGSAEAETLFGVQRDGAGWKAAPGTEVVAEESGAPFGFITRRPDRAPTLFVPRDVAQLTSTQADLLAKLSLALCGDPLTLPAGITATTFLNGRSLFLALGDQGDAYRQLEITVKPEFFDPALKGASFRVVDLDRAEIVPARWENNALHFQISCAPNDGRMLQILANPSTP